MNFGAVTRTAHAFGASFTFSVAVATSMREIDLVDTSSSTRNIPFYEFDTTEELMLPKECALVGVEITEDAIDLPSFRHPRCAAYVVGPERGGLSDAMLGRCDHVVKIPTRFSINVGLASALVMYDRLITLGRFAPRPEQAGGPSESRQVPAFGAPAWVRKQRRQAKAAKRDTL